MAVPSAPLHYLADERLFVTFAWLNASGYDHQPPGVAMSNTRERLRQELGTLPGREARGQIYRDLLDTAASRSGATAASTKAFGEFLLQAHLTDYSFLLSGPPDFRHTRQPLWGGATFFSIALQEALLWWQYGALPGALADFYRQADGQGLWRRYEQDYNAWIQRIRPASNTTVTEMRQRLGLGPGVPVTVVPNLLGCHGLGHTSFSKGQAFLVINPLSTDSEALTYIRHEYLHPQINPMVERNRHLVQASVDALLPLIESAPAIRHNGYDRFSIVEESVIRAIDVAYSSPASLWSQYDAGFVLVPALVDRLHRFAPERETLEDALKSCFSAFKPEMERRRWQERQSN